MSSPARGLLERVDAQWTKLEVAICAAVASALVASLVTWVALKGLSSKTTETFLAGYVFRAATLALVLGAGAFRISRGKAWAGWLAAVAGIALGWPMREWGTDYFGNIFAWLQDGSSLTWLGGLRGLGTRLTLWLALVGASLATSSGRHVTIDVVTRSLGERARVPLIRLGGVVATVVCLASAWGFFDFIAIDSFGAAPKRAPGEKFSLVQQGVRRHLARGAKQLAIDLRVLPRVLGGAPWDKTVTGADWKAWLGEGGAEAAPSSEAELTQTRSPLLSFPDEASRGLLVKDFSLILPFGLLMLALRFVLWLLRGAPVESAHGAADAPEATAAGAPS